MPTIGRGGAGNIQTLIEENNRVSADLEASQSAAESYTNNLQPSDYKREEQQYAHSGRGGAGNYYSPKDLKEQGRFEGADSSHILGDGTPAPDTLREKSVKSEPPRYYGRGGAGNYAWGAVEEEAQAAKKREEDEERKKEQLSADVEQGVKETLAMPEKAKLSGAQPY